jgi:hypothetical protein
MVSLLWARNGQARNGQGEKRAGEKRAGPIIDIYDLKLDLPCSVENR